MLEKINESDIQKLLGKEITVILNSEEFKGKLRNTDPTRAEYQFIAEKDFMTILQVNSIYPSDNCANTKIWKNNGKFVIDKAQVEYSYPTSLYYRFFKGFLKNEQV
jgi:hypothetical protein